MCSLSPCSAGSTDEKCGSKCLGGRRQRSSHYGPDLLNSIPNQREYTSLIIRVLEPLETGDSVYLYLLTNHGDLYPVHALRTPPAGHPWTMQIHPLLDRAIQDVYGIRPMDAKNSGIRTAATFQALGELGAQLLPTARNGERANASTTHLFCGTSARSWTAPAPPSTALSRPPRVRFRPPTAAPQRTRCSS
jgi:hypothetical protein